MMIPTFRLGLAMGVLWLACPLAAAQTPPRGPEAPQVKGVPDREAAQPTPAKPPKRPPPRFTPSEEISPDKPVSFPADI